MHTFGFWFLVDALDFINQSVVKLHSLRFKVLSGLMLVIFPEVNFLGNRLDFVVEDSFVVLDQE